MTVVTLADAADASALGQLMFDAFCDDYFRELFPGEAGKAYYDKAYSGFLLRRTAVGEGEASAQDDIAKRGVQAQIFTIRNEKGELASAALYWIFPEGVSFAEASTKMRWPEAQDGMPKDLLDGFFEAMTGQHNSVMKTEGHVFLEVIMTHPDAQKQGHASILLKEGNKLADDRDMPCYLDAEVEAMRLYEKNGYVFQEKDHVEGSHTRPMRRPRKSDR